MIRKFFLLIPSPHIFFANQKSTHLYHSVAIRIRKRGFQPSKSSFIEEIELHFFRPQFGKLQVHFSVPLGYRHEADLVRRLLRLAAILGMLRKIFRILVQVIEHLRVTLKNSHVIKLKKWRNRRMN